MHHAGKRAFRVLFRQDTGHVVICIARMDDERQAGLPCGLDMQAQADLLHLGAVGGVVIVEPGFADADELGVLGQRHQFFDLMFE